jgi:arylformamidase
MAADRRVYDLSATLETHMAVWPTSSLPEFEPVAFVARDGHASERVQCSSHTGTHLDAPSHFLEDGATVDAIPPERLVGTAAVLDVRAGLEGPVIPAARLRKEWPDGPSPEIALLRTGWSGERARTKRYLYDFPGIDAAGAAWLVQQGVKGVGIDTLGIDPYANTEFEAHKTLLRAGVWILEALDHLDSLSPGVRYTLVAAPLKLARGSGAMARVFAWEA